MSLTRDELALRLADLAQVSSHGIVLMGASGRIKWVNEAFCRITGYSQSEVEGQFPIAMFAAPETDPETLEYITAQVVAGKGFRCEVQLMGRDGRRFWIDLDQHPTWDESGKLTGFSSIQSEITSSRALQDQLKASSGSLRAASQLARLGAWEFDVRQGLVRWSPELKSLFGREDITESVAESLNVYDPADQPMVEAQMRNCINTGEPIEFVTRALRADGETIWISVMGECDMVDGAVVSVHGACQDISEHMMVTAELREAARFTRGVIDSAGAMLAVIDADGNIIEANSAFRQRAEILRNGESYLLGRSLFAAIERLPQPHPRTMLRGIGQVLSGELERFERPYANVDGEWFRITVQRFAGDGPVRAVALIQSIDNLKRSERRLRQANDRLKVARDAANQANAAKSAFLATMSHEIRTPLNGVLGMAQAMARDPLPERQRERLEVISQSGESLLALLNDLLDLSRIEAGQMELEDGVIDLAGLAGQVRSTFGGMALAKGLGLTVELADGLHPYWRGDPSRVRQVLYNLVANAVKFTASGRVDVDISRRDAGLIFRVRRTGPGIAPHRLQALFEKFVQADASTTRRYGGSGLGLAICRDLASLMGGAVEASSQLGKGAEFCLRLPLLPALQPETQEEEPLLSDGHGLEGLRILVAEDNPMNQLVLKTLLGQVGLEVHCVSDGLQAVEAMATSSWDMILMDVQMPVMDGPTAVRQIREMERSRGKTRIPILALTANATAHHEAEYLAAGMDILVPKPLQLERLLNAMDQALAEPHQPAASASFPQA